MKTKSPRLTRFFRIIIPGLLIVIFLELGLRLTGFGPVGYFDFLKPSGSTGLYPANTTIEMGWGRQPYTVNTNELGLRIVPETSSPEKADIRIATLGDSVTDGFYVNDENTFQGALQKLLNNLDQKYSIFNIARGGCSIDEQLKNLTEVALPLNPDIAVLTFVTNDIKGLAGKSLNELIKSPSRFKEHSPSLLNLGYLRDIWMRNILGTAIAENVFRALWNIFISSDISEKLPPLDQPVTPEETLQNSKQFMLAYQDTDAIALKEKLSESTEKLLKNYLSLLNMFAETCKTNNITPVFVYFSPYPQIYLEDFPDTLKNILREESQKMGFHFLDLTEGFKENHREKRLHYAPIDYHLNSMGNKLFARLLFEFLVSEKVISTAKNQAEEPD